MTFAVIADVHGNLEALEAVLEAGHQRQVRHWLCLGDVVGYGAAPEACVQRVRSAVDATVLGNHDAVAAGLQDGSSFSSLAAAAIAWTRRQLSAQSLDYLGGCTATALAWGCRMVHGSPHRPLEWTYVTGGAAAGRALDSSGAWLCFVGHTHQPGVWYRPTGPREAAAPDAAYLPPQAVRTLAADYRYLINAGSVGQPRDGDWRPCFVVCDPAARWIEFVRVPYDIAAAQRRIRDAGLAAVLASRLAAGR